jgi:beta-phosphoglucomutase-like phosphatase (HAD superfamily)
MIYDFDDTLVESERVNDALFSAHLRQAHGVALTQDELDLLYGFSWSVVFDWLREHRGLTASRTEIWGSFVEAKRAYLREHRLRIATGLELMFSLPVPRAIVSGSTRAEIHMMMENAGLRPDMVDCLVAEDDCSRGKPDPEGYHRALERLCVPAAEALVFEDSNAGIAAARAAGIPVAFVAELASRDGGAAADHRFASLAEAYPWVLPRIRAARPEGPAC